MSAFDPVPDAPYGLCSTCSLVLATEDAANEHMRETREASENGRSHTVRVTNPSRASRIRSRVASIVDDAIEEAVAGLDRIVERGDLTEAEVTKALSMWSDFQDAWDEHCAVGAS